MLLSEMVSTKEMKDPFNFCSVDVEGAVTASSTQVAEYFEKQHKHVLRDIEKIIEAVSKDFAEQNYFKTSYKDDRGRNYPAYEMTKDGFTMLAMGYTGPRAMEFKEAYINAFNTMQKMLESRQKKENAHREFLIRRAVAEELRAWKKNGYAPATICVEGEEIDISNM